MRIIVDEYLERAADLLRPSLALYIGGMGARASTTTTRPSPRWATRRGRHYPGSLPDRRREGRDRGRSHSDGRRRHPDWLLGQDRRQDPVLAATVLSTFCVNFDLCHLGKIAGLLRR